MYVSLNCEKAVACGGSCRRDGMLYKSTWHAVHAGGCIAVKSVAEKNYLGKM